MWQQHHFLNPLMQQPPNRNRNVTIKSITKNMFKEVNMAQLKSHLAKKSQKKLRSGSSCGERSSDQGVVRSTSTKQPRRPNLAIRKVPQHLSVNDLDLASPNNLTSGQ